MKIGVIGCSGKMGKEILKEIIINEQSTLTGGMVRKNSNLVNTTIGSLIGMPDCNIMISDDIEEICKNSDVIIEFTSAEYTTTVINIAAKYNKCVVSGTTGITDQDFVIIKEKAVKIPILWSANMSIGINLLTLLCKTAATSLDSNFDIEIIEAHHRNKIDAPSGTAIILGKEIASAKNLDFNENAVLNRNQLKAKRMNNQIGFSAIRGGNIVGDHSVLFIGDHEMIELSHKAFDRAIYAKGAVTAALWLKKQKPGFYTIQDVLS